MARARQGVIGSGGRCTGRRPWNALRMPMYPTSSSLRICAPMLPSVSPISCFNRLNESVPCLDRSTMAATRDRCCSNGSRPSSASHLPGGDSGGTDCGAMNDSDCRVGVSSFDAGVGCGRSGVAAAAGRLRRPGAVPQDTRVWRGGVALWLFSWLVGLSTWLLGAAFTFGSFGWIGLIVGLLLFGIGVVPLGVFGAVWQGEPSFAGLLLAMAAGTYAIRFCGIWAMSGADEAPL